MTSTLIISLPSGVTVGRFKARSEPNACMGLPSPYRFYVLGYRGDEIVFCEGGGARDRRDGLTLAARRIAELEAAR